MSGAKRVLVVRVAHGVLRSSDSAAPKGTIAIPALVCRVSGSGLVHISTLAISRCTIECRPFARPRFFPRPQENWLKVGRLWRRLYTVIHCEVARRGVGSARSSAGRGRFAGPAGKSSEVVSGPREKSCVPMPCSATDGSISWTLDRGDLRECLSRRPDLWGCRLARGEDGNACSSAIRARPDICYSVVAAGSTCTEVVKQYFTTVYTLLG